jgi:predicted GNAT family acetyltransferase
MTVSLHDSVAEFLDSTYKFRSQFPFETNIISSVAQSVRDGSRTYDAYFWWSITDAAGEIVGIAMRTAPHGALLSPMPAHAVKELADAISVQDDLISGVGGSREVVRAFVKAYSNTGSPGSTRAHELAGEELLYVLQDLTIPSVKGEMRVAEISEFELLHDWFLDFAEEAGILVHDARGSIEDGIKRKSMHWWVVDGQIVSLAGHAPLVDVPGGIIARIGPVYTPPDQRRRGYAGALTASLSDRLISKGARVMLYTDAKNPTSNSVYQKIGYVKIADNERITFVNPQ